MAVRAWRTFEMRVNAVRIVTILLLLVLAFSVRLIPLQWSPLPYNIDGLSEVRVADDITRTGHLDFTPNASHTLSYVEDMPVLGMVIAYFSSSIGVDPLQGALVLTALIGSFAVLVLYLMFTRYWGSSRAVLAAGISAALLGSLVFSAGCTWKETLGFLLLLLALNSYPSRSEPRHFVIFLASLAFLPFTHHHATIVGFIIVTFAVIIDFSNRPKGTRIADQEVFDACAVFSVWFIAVLYYFTIHLPYLDYLSPETDLYLYLAVALLFLLVAVRMSRRNRPLSQIPFAPVLPVAGAALMVVNYTHPLFSGTQAPAAAIAIPFLAYLILTVPSWQGAQLAFARVGKSKNLVLAMVFGPLSLITFAFLRSLDTTSYTVIYRTFDFLMLPFAMFIGLGFAMLIKGREKLGMIAGVSLAVICASTLPVAYGSQELFGVENQTYWFEYDAVKWFSDHDVNSVVSDQRLSDTGNRLFDLEGSRGLPYDMREGISLDKGRFYVIEGEWSTKGAQEFPLGIVKVDQAHITETLYSADVVYVGGSASNLLFGFYER